MLTDHKINAVNEAIDITPGYASPQEPWVYTVKIPGYDKEQMIAFHHNDPEGVVQTGFTNEVLIAILLDRLRCLQTTALACRENAIAITKIEEALHWLGHRSKERQQRGVEGTQQP